MARSQVAQVRRRSLGLHRGMPARSQACFRSRFAFSQGRKSSSPVPPARGDHSRPARLRKLLEAKDCFVRAKLSAR